VTEGQQGRQAGLQLVVAGLCPTALKKQIPVGLQLVVAVEWGPGQEPVLETGVGLPLVGAYGALAKPLAQPLHTVADVGYARDADADTWQGHMH